MSKSISVIPPKKSDIDDTIAFMRGEAEPFLSKKILYNEKTPIAIKYLKAYVPVPALNEPIREHSIVRGILAFVYEEAKKAIEKGLKAPSIDTRARKNDIAPDM